MSHEFNVVRNFDLTQASDHGRVNKVNPLGMLGAGQAAVEQVRLKMNQFKVLFIPKFNFTLGLQVYNANSIFLYV
jgi:hypothetical protein